MEKMNKTFAGESFFTVGGQLDVTSIDPLTVAFIGGSLTEGEVGYEGTSLDNENLKWANVVIRFLSGLFPLRPITAVNVGLGGTGTALVIGLVSGILLMAVGTIFAKELLILMQCQPAVLDQATLYMRIFFLGMPIIMLYSFVAALLHTSGDSVRPMSYMLIAGVLNVAMNILFVGLFNLTVAIEDDKNRKAVLT